MLAQRKLFLMHERNQAALEKLHREDHDAEHEDIQNQFRRVLADTRVPLRDRVRWRPRSASSSRASSSPATRSPTSTNEELGDMLRDIIHDVLRG